MYITLTKKKIFVLFCLVAGAFVLLLQFMSVTAEHIELKTNAKRVEYVKTLGVTLKSDDYIQKQVVIPEEFGEVYAGYNELQREADFDLSRYRGRTVTVYTYECDGDIVVNLMIYKGKLIGGDIAETKFGGEMTPLKRK